MPKPIHRVTTVARAIEPISEDVLAFELADPDDWELPPFTAGAHIDVHVPGGAVRQYSLFGDPAENTRYRIAVKREDLGRGGSLGLHRDLEVGATVLVSLPRNHFPLRPGRRHVMIAGGIGITPFMSMISVLQRSGEAFELHYASRHPGATPFLDQLAQLRANGTVQHYFSRSEPARRLDLPTILARAQPDAQVYCCGPLPLIKEVLRLGRADLPDRLHVELFGGEGVEPAASDKDYTIELAKSRRLVVVRRGQTMLAALREAGVEMEASCEGGVCLECKTRYLAGTPIHRDLTMPAAERGQFLTPCVSASSSERLVLDL